MEYFHSVRLYPERCKACVNCIKHCPTEAIRIRGGVAKITESRCIDCGECIRHCPNRAKTAITDTLEDIRQFQYNIALPAPSLYAQFDPDVPVEAILAGLLNLGFDDVYEVAEGAEIVSAAVKDYLRRPDIRRPAISSACPAVIRLVQVKFPELIGHIIPVAAPVEVAARIARAERSAQLGLAPENIGTWFITPCPAKMTAVRQPLGMEKSHVSGAIGISKIYPELLKNLPKVLQNAPPRRATWAGVGWAISGGEVAAVGEVPLPIMVDGIHAVSQMLEQVSLGKLHNVDYIEAQACAGGCIGGPLTVENRFAAEYAMRQRLRRIADEDRSRGVRPRAKYREEDVGLAERRAIEPRPVLRLDEDILRAMDKVELMEETLRRLPGLDCGACGSPNCKALAEDIVQGSASETDCMFKLRERVRDLAHEMFDLAQKLPPSLNKAAEGEGKDPDGK